MTRERRRSLAARLSGAVAAALGFAFLLPATVAAHTLNATYASRLPLAVYVVGAAATVALSFIFVIVRDVRAQPPDLTAEGTLPPAWLRFALRAIGLFGWAWIIAQGIAGGSSDGDVATLFLWVYGWVGLAIICAIIGPAWQFLDPFSTLHDLGAWVLRALHVQGWAIADFPERARALAGGRGLRVLRLAGARRRGRAVHLVHRGRRLHRAHAGDDGPVRSRRMARARRDVHGLVPDSSVASPTGGWSTRTGASPAGPSGAACSSRAGAGRT